MGGRKILRGQEIVIKNCKGIATIQRLKKVSKTALSLGSAFVSLCWLRSQADPLQTANTLTPHTSHLTPSHLSRSPKVLELHVARLKCRDQEGAVL